MISQLYQSGFRSNHSTSSTLLRITNDLLIASEENYVLVLLLLEFSKSFDSVDHRLLCAKHSNQYGFTTSTVTFIRSNLGQRMQCVWVNGSKSRSGPRFGTCAFAIHAFYKRHCLPNIILQLPSVRRLCAALYQLSSC
jgi:hypothetical protein